MPVTNNTAIIVGTNVFCVISINQSSGKDAGPPPVCIVKLVNQTTAFRVWGVRLPPEELFAIDLVDTNGQMLDKTEIGKKYGQSLTQKEVNDRFLPLRIAHGSMSAGFWAEPGAAIEVGILSIPKNFKLTHVGEYTLHLRMRLIQTCVSDLSGTVRTNILDGDFFGPSRTSPTVFQSVWLPEVVGKVLIRPEDIPLPNLSPNAKKNSPAK